MKRLKNDKSLKIACLEEIAYKMGYITKDKLFELAEPLMKNQYGQYLVNVATQVELRNEVLQMNVIETKLSGVKILEPKVFGDHRGYFMESYNKNIFDELGLNFEFIQDNQSLSAPVGTLRGLHFQLNPKAQTKVVRCVTGAIYDVAVDISKGFSYIWTMGWC